MCSRSPRGLAYVSLYSTYSNSTPTLCSCSAGTTARATMPAWCRQMFHQPRLIWQVTFSGCVRTSGRISITCKKRVSHGYWARVYPVESPCAIWQESFSQERGRSQVAQYWSHEAGSQESPFWEVLQTLQETWGHAYYTCYQGLLQVQERRDSESWFLRCQKGR